MGEDHEDLIDINHLVAKSSSTEAEGKKDRADR